MYKVYYLDLDLKQFLISSGTQKNHLDELEIKIGVALEKQRKAYLSMQRKEQREQRKLQRQMDAVLRRQTKLERERTRQDATFKKLKKEQELRSRLFNTRGKNFFVKQS